jgi:hypothetical protein
LEIKKFSISPDGLRTLISRPGLAGLKNLLVGGFYSDSGDPWDRYNLEQINQAIETHLPNLERLEWSQHDYNYDMVSLTSFGSFNGLTQLRKLKFDYNLLEMEMVPATGVFSAWMNEQLQLTQPYDYLPDSLNHLHICSLTGEIGGSHRRIDVLLQAAHTMSLDTIEVSLTMENWD